MRFYAPIEKMEEQEDGSIIVSGYASSEDVDSQGEVVTAGAMKAALPDYMKFGNVREMHQPIAAGVALDASVQDDGRTWIKAHIVDDSSVKKVKKKVLKGFSIGGKVTGRDDVNKNTITGITLNEISLVDRPANPKAVLECWKADAEKPAEEPKASEPEAPKEPETPAAEDPAAQETPAEPAADPADKADAPEVTKGMYGVAALAQLLDTLNCLQQDAQWEAEWEGDNSELPGMLKEAMKNLGQILIQMTKEEVAELAEQPADLQKMVDAAVTKAVSDATKPLLEKNETLEKRVKELEALPAPAKGALKIVEKSTDSPSVTVEEPKDALGMIKKLHQTGGKQGI